MEKKQGIFQKKSYGFYVSAVVILLTIVTMLVYIDAYGSNERYISWLGVGFMIAGVVLGVVLSLLNLGDWATAAMAICNFVGLMQYITKIYNYVVIVMVGIDINTLSTQFISCTVLFSLLTVLSIANIFFKQAKTKEELVK